MPKLVAVALNNRSYPVLCAPTQIQLEKHDFCVIEDQEIGETTGFVCAFTHKTDIQCKHQFRPQILRKANSQEVRAWHFQMRRENEALATCKEKAAQHKLDMRISQVKFDDKQRKVIFYFTADKRVDFRELVKELAATFHARIELWQIGVRDETRKLKGMGVCGRALCCSTWLKDFMPVSIKCAKAQDIPFSPAKLSGVCGRLRCCLAYEFEIYKELGKGVPPIGATVISPDYGEARVIDRNLLTQNLVILDQKSQTHVISTQQVHKIKDIGTEKETKATWAIDEDILDEATALTLADPEEEMPKPRQRKKSIPPATSSDKDKQQGQENASSKKKKRRRRRGGRNRKPTPPQD